MSFKDLFRKASPATPKPDPESGTTPQARPTVRFIDVRPEQTTSPVQDLLRSARKLQSELKKRAEFDRTERSQLETKYGMLLTKHRDLLDKFLEITERKVSTVDDYGDENWSVLPDEIHRCLTKLARREQAIDVSKVEVKSGGPYPAKSFDGGKYRDSGACYLAACLEAEFFAHHQERKKLESIAQGFRELAGVEFENYLANLLKSCGFVVSGTPVTGDQGADLIVRKDGRTIAIQAKGYKEPVGNSAVQEIVAALRFYNADEGWVVTNSVFTTSARALAHANNIKLIDGNDLKTFAVAHADSTSASQKQTTVRFIDL